LECDFYQHLQEEEGYRFVAGSELAEIVQYKEDILLSKQKKEENKTMKLKKSELIEKMVVEMDNFIDEETTYKQKTEVARETVNLFFNSIKETLASGDRVELRGFGSFYVREYDGYIGRNPKTGAKVDVKPKRLPVFRAGKPLKAMVDK